MEENPQGLELFIARQGRKRHLAEIWARLAGLKPGMVIVDFGCGPGILTREYIRILGSDGFVYGVEQNTEIAQTIEYPIEEPNNNVRYLFQDYESAINLEHSVHIIFLTDTLHHLAEPLPVLQRIREACGDQTKVFIAEYDPEMAGRFGAKPHRRMPKAKLLTLLFAAGFQHDGIIDTEDEHYAVIARCSSG